MYKWLFMIEPFHVNENISVIITTSVVKSFFMIIFQMGIPLYNLATGLCVSAEEQRSGAGLVMAMCSTPKLTKWDLVDVL